ncbi:uracil phosphoribosyltransferase [Roseivirga pacifica]|uniref:uracil phosphoribosyltransferase n=1 Tax=Roseivirga pacifica TaxID=1267423 RepID=UPI002095DC91|nr:uracil phosphoribosyltransferase [Roseivirga pacifica]MCO6359661.1 uracil phosphoribosyltransferase [Roseivirga pacifica]MCO6367031.1 uracil phosphoribosyltransferase [Roseivirga pacifica]MCO6370437.1 uracil phosphoribosyltransferase [Roseivirga pacifica]MCO6374688.1 uracil phosphoribosyltransferase [Roseivirga pacifica]MCO6379946.1 uracil phosphoribosyltransferase [Roseivirga pacifica]
MKPTIVLNETPSVLNNYLAEIRSVEIQRDSMRFRQNLRRIGWITAQEISKAMAFEQKTVTTPLAEAHVHTVAEEVVIISILRAAIPFGEGLLDVFDKAESGFVGAWREEEIEGEEVRVSLGYTALPDLTGKTLILADPMLATGKSLVKTVNQILKSSTPSKLHLATVISAPEGISYISKNMPMVFQLWTSAIDEKLNEKAYIVPGLGDAGDLAFGQKK